MDNAAVWLGLLGLGAVHGLNPAMGWLFAVGIGLQERTAGAVWRSLGPLAVGHLLAIALVVMGAALMGLVLPAQWLKWLVALTLIGCGLFHLRRHRHPRFGGMRMSARDLVVWSFLMASAHGAGLMALPLVLNAGPHSGAHASHVMTAGLDGVGDVGVMATLIHTAGYLAVTGLLAVVVYEKVGLRILRRGWI
ncbi:MAG TPA: hypothetical protein VFO52_01850, partial [Longimicrobiales bacterium]|nr:hypothetical protein [Longimicrobiales bacterium]